MSDASSDIQDWNRNADAYAQMVGTPEDKVYITLKPMLWDCLGDLRDLSVLDLGCGHGWLSRDMHQQGAQVWGIDGSAELLSKARSACPEAHFMEADLSLGLPPLETCFDRIVSYMVLMDIPEIGDLLKSVRQALQPDGKFIFTMTHPCFFNYKSRQDATTGQMYCAVTGYLEPEVWWIENFGGHRHYHRSLTDYFELLRASELAVTRLYEPPQILEGARDDFRRKLPKFMLIEAVPVP